MSEEKLDQRSDRAQSLFKGLTLLQSFSTVSPKMTLSECADVVGMNRATARRFLLTLVDLGFLHQEGRYFSLTPKVLTLGYNYLSTLPWWQAALPVMENVSRSLAVSCSAGVLSGNELVFVARVPGPSVFSVVLGAGRPVPPHVTAMGRVLLSELAPNDLDRILANLPPIPFTPTTVNDPALLRPMLERVREDGYAVVDKEFDIGFRSIAVPIRDHKGVAIAAIGISIHVEQASLDEVIANMLPVIRTAANAISAHVAA